MATIVGTTDAGGDPSDQFAYFGGVRVAGMDSETQVAYTRVMSGAEVESCLRDVGHGVLSLADGDESYAIPLYHHYDDGSLFFRLGHTPGDLKGRYLDATDVATYVVAEARADGAVDSGWSVVARGPIAPVTGNDRAAIEERFPPVRLFDESRAEVTVTLYELDIESLSGRQN